MRVHSNLKTFSAINPVVTMGIFDGVHKGHRSIIELLKKTSQEYNGESVIFTFWPHPRIVLSENKMNMSFITTLDEKIRLLSFAGVDHLVIFPFSIEFSKMTSREFVDEILVTKIGIKCLIIGHDHTFGHKQEGNYQYLEQCSLIFGFDVKRVNAVVHNNIIVSSSNIRKYLLEGNIRLVNELLTYNYCINGVVVGGKKIGRTIDFPTANIFIEEDYKQLPADGVYAVWVLLKKQTYRGMLNIGIRPTLRDGRTVKSIEVHILDFDSNIYKEHIKVEFVDRIRAEKKFSDIDELKAQLQVDKFRVRKILEK